MHRFLEEDECYKLSLQIEARTPSTHIAKVEPTPPPEEPAIPQDVKVKTLSGKTSTLLINIILVLCLGLCQSLFDSVYRLKLL